MQQTTTKGGFQDDLPKDPEKNPPDTIEEIDNLILQLQNKSLSIKHQLDAIDIREKCNLEVDYEKVKRMMYARKMTNKSISALQKIAKQKRLQLLAASGTSFETCFFAAAKDSLPADIFSQVLEKTYAKLREAEALIRPTKSSPA